ncbi:Na(+)-translocating NADH-quinone reductase subunit C [Ferrimonas sediminicola]|uniref:Na(+)-translocating NADH-quinone reductase subunit C n=1 Tax=Ferrimonas sediminicola TaxID=2569538 RepID=A0A4U1BEM7_9GAMM|nr:Na(+)-translocating NADH-quinone reductase subunit C [Ferrimonas sediminicola]TKB49315.1 Na(+)-translocating NADH-quinone reductase subunit C [Ferrimonas sediminicola]
MAFNKDSVLGTMTFSVVLCLLCSFMITGTAEVLKERKLAKKRSELKRYVLVAANVEGDDIDELFDARVTPMLVNLDSGTMENLSAKEILDFDDRMAAINPDTSIKPRKDTARIKRRANQARVFKVTDDNGQLASVVMPIHGKGLWSVVYGYVAVQPDLNTIEGLVISEHGETPGLTDFLKDPQWLSGWHDKRIFDDSGKPVLAVVKGGAKKGDIHGVDGVSGATKTGRGLQKAVTFWFGPEGYQTFLNTFKKEA